MNRCENIKSLKFQGIHDSLFGDLKLEVGLDLTFRNLYSSSPPNTHNARHESNMCFALLFRVSFSVQTY